MKTSLYTLLISYLFFIGCKPSSKKSNTKTQQKNSIIYSFAFIGCNRVDGNELNNKDATDESSANIYVLKRILNEISNEKRKPDALFLLGDIVYGASTKSVLDKQLKKWRENIQDPSFSKIKESGIEIIAIPGNHEMLYEKNYGIPKHNEWPLKGAQETWMKYMGAYIPKDRESIKGKDSIINQSTFSFIRKKNAFIVINTDTYNSPTKENPYGIEGYFPIDWVESQIQKYRKDKEINHIFVLGHKPYYIFDLPFTGHYGLPEGEKLWNIMKKNKVNSMLASHFHDYQRMQPEWTEGPYQIIAANGGSQGPASFFGYTIINIMSNGKVKLISKGFEKPEPYYKPNYEKPTLVKDTTTLTWEKNKNPYDNFLNLDFKTVAKEIEEKLKR